MEAVSVEMGRGDRNKVSSSGKMFALSLEMFKLSFMINKARPNIQGNIGAELRAPGP